MSITIKELSERSGVKVPTIRYYERQGLLPEPARTATGLRRYGTVDVARLRFVRFGRGLGMEIDGIRALIEMVGDGNGEEIIVAADAIAERADRMKGLCVELRAVSAAIIAGAIDEASAFGWLLEGQGPQIEEPAEILSRRAMDKDEAPEDEVISPPEAQPDNEAHLAVNGWITGESGTKAIAENDASVKPLPKPKHKRTRARS